MTDEKRNQREEEEEQKSSQFKVDDRRIFTAEGDLRSAEGSGSRQEAPRTERSERPAEQGSEKPAAQESTSSESAFSSKGTRTETPPVDFSSFLISLATTALVHLGEIPDPATGEASENLEAGKQMIEIISVLKEKTKGNLAEDENRLLDELLYELRMKYLARARVISV